MPTVASSSPDTGSGNGSIPSNIDPTGNGAPGVQAHLAAGSVVDEADPAGSTSMVKIQLRARPSTPVVISFTTFEVEVVGGPVTIEPDDWDEPRFVDVRARQDTRAETSPHPASIGFTVGGDAAFRGSYVTPIALGVDDDDIAGGSCAPGAGWNAAGTGGALRLAEGGASATCSLTLAAAPAGTITVTPISSDPDVRVTPSVITIPADSTTPVPVQLSAPSDAIDRAERRDVTLSWRIVTSDPMYAGVSFPANNIDLIDDDTAGMTLSTRVVTTREGDTAEIVNLRLDTQPAAPLTITMATDAGAATAQVRAGASSATLQVLPTTWTQMRSMSISAIDDHRAEGAHRGTVDIDIDTSDPAYAALEVPRIEVEVADNDVAGVSFAPTDGGTSVAERGTTDVVDVRLRSAPSSTVTVDLEGSGITITPAHLTFSADGWNTPQRVTVTAIDDGDVEPAATERIVARTHSADPGYLAGGAGAPSTHDVTVQSDDIAQVVLTQSLGTTVLAEGGAGDEYTLALASRPTSDVTILVETTGEVAVDPAKVTFTTGSWSSPQAVRVTATNDDKDEPTPHRTSIRNVVVAGDATWRSVTVPRIDVEITDDDETVATSEPEPPSGGGEEGADEDDGGDAGSERTTRVVPPVPAAVVKAQKTDGAVVASRGATPRFEVPDRSEAPATSRDIDTSVPGAVLAQGTNEVRGGLVSSTMSDAELREGVQARSAATRSTRPAPAAERAVAWAAEHPVVAVPAVVASAAGGLLMLAGMLGDPLTAGRQGASSLRFPRRRP